MSDLAVPDGMKPTEVWGRCWHGKKCIALAGAGATKLKRKLVARLNGSELSFVSVFRSTGFRLPKGFTMHCRED
jgi:hypothetical protein